MAAERAALRAARDFAAADAIRDRLLAMGFEVEDSPEGPVVRAVEKGGDPGARLRADQVPSVLDEPASGGITAVWVVQGWPEDVVRGVRALRATGGEDVHEVVVHCIPDPPTYPEGVEVVALEADPGWGAAANVGLRRARGGIVVVFDGSVEAQGSIGALREALDDPSVGLVGPWGIVTDDLRTFRDDDGPLVDAIEAYCLAFRRSLAEDGLAFDPKFTFYRSADIEFSFRVAERGLARRIVPLPLVRHEHRMWHATAPAERDRLSKRNFYRFLDRYRGRFDLTVAGEPPG